LYKERSAFLIPTLCTIASITGEERDTASRFATDPLITSRNILTPEETSCMTTALNLKVPGASTAHAYASVRALKDAGIDIVAGTDAVPGLLGTAMGVSMMMELWLYVHRGGFTPREALRSATGVAARRFGFRDRGAIEVGRRADLVLVDGDPVYGEITDLMKVRGVWKQGVRTVAHGIDG
jgi:imidazolonepropionase-like amidohydrolase